MKLLFVLISAASLLTGCTSNEAPGSAPPVTNELSEEKNAELDRNAESSKGDDERTEPPKVIYETIFDKPFAEMEDDRVFIFRTHITNIEEINQEDLENSIIAGLNIDYNLFVENSDGKHVEGLGLTKRDTRIFRYVSGDEKELAGLEDLRVGQEIEVQYLSPITPLYLATEIIILNES
ncbi:hypothetical protein [Paenibacillus tarimensis]|uniref:hypothetical protein n=1 Tax=Paenibacillus tarimensis TaxID=416012 RepID=UPI001F3B3365|nr:hypothetical protein [Paenibacillus tarimensis]MCF2945468.1 hypothetical protein [Paenibacillus tarimensis]